MNNKRKLINILLASTMVLTSLPLNVLAKEEANIKRLAGNTRVETSQVVSEEIYDKIDTVIIAGYNGEVDALTGTILAGKYNAPLLIVSDKASDIKKVTDEIGRLGATKAVLLGAEQVISAKIASKLEDAGVTVTREAGHDRIDTAVAIAKEAGDSHDHIFLTNDGRSGELADALASGPVSARDQAPILLTSQSKLPAQTASALEKFKVKEVTIIGGKVAVSAKVESQLKDAGYIVNRVAGNNRWETAVEIADKYFPDSDKAILANDGRFSYADALVGGYLGNKKDAPIVLTQSHKINSTTKSYLENNASFAYILGGFNSVSADIDQSILEAEKIRTATAAVVKAEENKNQNDLDAAKVLVEGLADSKAKIELENRLNIVQEKINELQLNKPYIASDGMTVNVTSIQKEKKEGSTRYTVSYILKNETLDKEIDEDSFKMFFEDGTYLNQYGFFGTLFPGDSLNRSYTFEVLNDKVPTLIEYGSDFFATEPSLNKLKWNVY